MQPTDIEHTLGHISQTFKMMKRKETSPHLRKIVIKIKNEDKSLKEIGEILNLSKSTLQVIVKNFEKTRL